MSKFKEAVSNIENLIKTEDKVVLFDNSEEVQYLIMHEYIYHNREEARSDLEANNAKYYSSDVYSVMLDILSTAIQANLD